MHFNMTDMAAGAAPFLVVCLIVGGPIRSFLRRADVLEIRIPFLCLRARSRGRDDREEGHGA